MNDQPRIRSKALTLLFTTMNRTMINTVVSRVPAGVPLIAAASIAFSLLAAPTTALAGAAEKFANAIPSCPWPDRLVPGTPSKLPEQFKLRAVQLPSGSAQVSVVEGFRFPVMPEGKTEPFANVKIELSETDKFAADRETIVANIRWIHSTSKDMEAPQPLLVDLNGFEGPMVGRASFSGTTLALMALFNEKEKLVVTIYLENAPPEQRGFQTKEQWNGMRDRFLIALTSCGAKAIETAGSSTATTEAPTPTTPVAPASSASATAAAAAPAVVNTAPAAAAAAAPAAPPPAAPSPTTTDATTQPVPPAAPLPPPIIIPPAKP